MPKVTYNGFDFTDGMTVTDASRPMPEFRAATTQIDGADGEQLDHLTVGPRECSFSVVAAGKTQVQLQDLARRMMAALAVREPKALRFYDEKDPDGTQLYRRAVPVGAFDFNEFIRAGKWTLRFVQHDPYLYGKERSVVLNAGVKTKVDAGGNAPAWPTATAKPKGSFYTFANGGGSEFVTFNAPFGSSQKYTLTVRSKQLRVSVSPAISGAAGLDTGSRFFALDGAMSLLASHKTTVTWRERWL